MPNHTRGPGLIPAAFRLSSIRTNSEPDFYSFYSPDLEGFTGVGHSVEDCLYQAKWGTTDHVRLLEEQGLRVPLPNPRPRIVVENAAEVRRAG